MAGLRIADDLTLPIEVTTDSTAILARKGAGKTYTAAVLAEEVVGAGVPTVVLDPMGAFWGLRSSADGKGPGLPYTILGGEHGDVPLEPTGGAEVADFVVDEPGWYVVDFSGFETHGSENRFAEDFATRLYRAKAPSSKRDPLLLVVDEADLFAPQSQVKAQRAERMLGAFINIARRGRLRGLGSVWISQRAASISKNVLTQTEVMIFLQTTSPNDHAAVRDWAKAYSTKDEIEEFIARLARLKKGEAWVWSPQLLEVFRPVQIRKRHTFDSSATPKAGERRIEPTTRAAVDLEALSARMAATIEKAKADDPKELKRQIADLRRELKAAVHVAELAASAAPAPAVITERVEVPVVAPELVDRLETLHKDATKAWDAAAEFGMRAQSVFDEVAACLRRLQARPPDDTHAARSSAAPVARATPRDRELEVARSPRAAGATAPRGTQPPAGDTRLGKAERHALTALAQRGPLTAKQVAILAGYAPGTGAINNALGALRTANLITRGQPIEITEAGVSALGTWEVLPDPGPELAEWWLARLQADGKLGGKAVHAHLAVLIDAWPDSVHKVDVAERAGYEPGTGASNNALGRLRTLQLIEGKGDLRASDELMGES